MKFSQLALPAVAAAACCAGLWAYQRTADFGFGGDDTPSNVKSEFYWSRLAYSTSMIVAAYHHGGWGGTAQCATPQGRPPVSVPCTALPE
jgi:hypothetical protein